MEGKKEKILVRKFAPRLSKGHFKHCFPLRILLQLFTSSIKLFYVSTFHFPSSDAFFESLYAVFFLSLLQQKAVESKKGIHFPLPPPPPLSCSLLEMPSKVAVLSPSPSPTYTVCTQQQLWGRREGAVTASTELFFSPPLQKSVPGVEEGGGRAME